MDIETRRLPRAATADILWYFNQSESELGLRSNHEAIIYRLAMGRRHSERAPVEVTERTLERAARSRRIERALRAMELGDRDIVWLAFGAPWPPELGDYGEIAALAPHTTAAQEAHRAAGTSLQLVEWLGRIARRHNDLTTLRAIREIHREAFALRQKGVVAYIEARRKVGARG